MEVLKTPQGRFRWIGYCEAISFLVLLGIAMPLKYFAGFPAAVLVVGSIHGGLFVLYLIAIANVSLSCKWSIGRVLGALLSSVLPFGPFVFDHWLHRQTEAGLSSSDSQISN